MARHHPDCRRPGGRRGGAGGYRRAALPGGAQCSGARGNGAARSTGAQQPAQAIRAVLGFDQPECSRWCSLWGPSSARRPMTTCSRPLPGWLQEVPERAAADCRQCAGSGAVCRACKQQVTGAWASPAALQFLGLRRDIPALLAAADVFISASHWEGAPVSLLEAMANGLPCVMTDAGDNAAGFCRGHRQLPVVRSPASAPGPWPTAYSSPAARPRYRPAAAQCQAAQKRARCHRPVRG